MELQKTLIFLHDIFSTNDIEHALIGGLALACYGSTRATVDLDLIIDESDKNNACELMLNNGFSIEHESSDIIQFSGIGIVDLLIARRPMAKLILSNSNKGGPNNIDYVLAEDLIGLKIQAYKNDPSREFQDKADIQYLISSQDKLDWVKIKKYAKLFDEWGVINEIKQRNKSG